MWARVDSEQRKRKAALAAAEEAMDLRTRIRNHRSSAEAASADGQPAGERPQGRAAGLSSSVHSATSPSPSPFKVSIRLAPVRLPVPSSTESAPASDAQPILSPEPALASSPTSPSPSLLSPPTPSSPLLSNRPRSPVPPEFAHVDEFEGLHLRSSGVTPLLSSSPLLSSAATLDSAALSPPHKRQRSGSGAGDALRLEREEERHQVEAERRKEEMGLESHPQQPQQQLVHRVIG